MPETKTPATAAQFPSHAAEVQAPRYAVGVVHYRAPGALERCLATVAGQRVAAAAVRVLDVDGCEADEAPRPAGVDWQRVPNRGYAAAANQLVAWAEGCGVDFLLLLNADVELDTGFAGALLAATEAHGVALAGGKLLRSDGRVIDSAGVTLPRNRRPRDRGSEDLDAGQHDQAERVFGASGAAMWIRLQAAADLRIDGELFDEDFFMYHEDTDLAWRAALLGWDVLYVPAATARHERGWQQAGRFEVPVPIRRHSFKNHYLQMIKNERVGEWLRDLPVIFGWEMLRFGFALLRDRAMLPAYLQALRLAPAAFRKRRALAHRIAERPEGRRAGRVRFGG